MTPKVRGNNHEKLKAASDDSTSLVVSVVGAIDQHGERWLHVHRRGAAGWAPLRYLNIAPSEFFGLLEKQGVVITASKTKALVANQAETVKFDEELFVVDRLGWHGSSYLWPGREIPITIGGLKAVNALGPTEQGWGTRGTFQAWRAEVNDLTRDQPLLTFVLCCSFLGIVLPLIDVGVTENPGFELVGPPGRGKTSALMLAASVFGVTRHHPLTVPAVKISRACRAYRRRDPTPIHIHLASASTPTICWVKASTIGW